MEQLTIEKALAANAQMAGIPINGGIELLPLCNMNCDMCYVRLTHREMEQKGRLRTAEEWLALGRQMQQAGVLFLLLTGGEPLLYPDFKEVYLGLKKMGMILTINTNGTLLDEEWADFFAQNKPRRINITLYGSSRAEYKSLCHYEEGYDKAIRAIKLLRERGVDVKINGSLVKKNVQSAMGLISLAEELDAAVNIDTYMYPATRERDKPFAEQSRLSPEEAAQAKMQIEKRTNPEESLCEIHRQMLCAVEESQGADSCEMKCRAGRSSFLINWQGRMQPCAMLTAPSVDVFDVGFADAWKYVTGEIQKIRLSSECASCRKREICQTCAAAALHESGRLDGVPEYLCRYSEEYLRLLKEEVEGK